MTSARLSRSGARRALVALVLPVLMAGCAANTIYRHGQREAALGDWDRAVLSFAKASTMKPENERYVVALAKAKQRASQFHFEKAKKYLEAGQLDLAIGELQQTTVLDPTNQHAQVELDKALIEWQRKRDTVGKTELEMMKEKAKSDRGVPRLNPSSNIPIILTFKDTEIGKIYEALSKASGINFLYDSKLDLKKKVTIELTNVSFENAMSTLMLMNKHFFKVVDENTILLADDSQQKRREIEDEVIKTFFLSNADVKDVQTLLRTLLDARKIVQNTQLNAITIRDTPNRVAIAEKIIESNDKSKAELVIDVELLEVSRTVSKTLGINLTPQRYTISFTGPTSLPLNNLGLLRQLGSYALGPIPSATLDFLKSDSGTRTIAKPQLRVTEGEKANLHIGDSVPIPTTTFNTTGTVGGSVVPITSFTYQEVGIVIEIEPRVHHNKEVTLKLNVEVSQLGEQVTTGQNQSSPAINTRQINTVIRLKDGETNLLAGLIRDDGTEGRSGFPGLIDVPGLRRIFSSQTSTRRETDLVLTLTPHIIRIPDIREEDLAALFIGTESNPHLRGTATSAFGPTPFARADGEEEEEEEAEEGEEEAEAEVEGEEEEVAGVPGEKAETAPAAAKPEAAKPEAPKPQPPGAAPAQAPGAQPQAAKPEPGKAAGAPAPGAAAPATGAPAPATGAQPAPTGPQPAPSAPPAPAGPPPGARGFITTPVPPPPPQPPPTAGANEPVVEEELPEEEGVEEAPAAPAAQPPPAEPGAPPLTLALAPGRVTVAGGGGFAFHIMVSGATNLQKVSLTLKYDPAVAEFDQGLEGVFMRSDGAQTSFAARKVADGTVEVEVQRMGGDRGVNGSGSIAAVRFRPVAPGRTLVNVLTATAQDFAGKPVPVNGSGADVTVSQ